MQPIYVTENGQYEITSINYRDGAISQITYRDATDAIVFVDDVNALFKHESNEEDDLQTSVLWDGKNDEVIAKVANILKQKENEYNEIAHEIVEETEHEITRKHRDEYYELAGAVATLYEIMKVVE